MSIKISELPQASTVNNTDVIPIVQGGTTKKATVHNLTQKNIIDLINPVEFRISTTHVYFNPSLTTNFLLGDKLSVNASSEVVIGAGISIVKVYVYVGWAATGSGSGTNDNRYIRVLKNGERSKNRKKIYDI